MNRTFPAVLAAVTLAFTTHLTLAAQPGTTQPATGMHPDAAMIPSTGALRNEVEQLRREVTQLRTIVHTLQALQPTMTSIMPEFAERFHVMHYAGDAGDWAVASHELLEMKRLTKISTVIDPDKGPMLQGFMTPNLKALGKAIDHGSNEAFNRAVNTTVRNCNSCHVAAGSPFIKVSLEVITPLSMRHPHDLVASKPGAATHTH